MRKSTVVDSSTGGSKDSRFEHLPKFQFRDVTSSVMLILLHGHICRVRTSSGMFLRRGQDKIIRTIEKRIADYTFIPVGT